jgi:cytochrome c oxidase subunit IV
MAEHRSTLQIYGIIFAALIGLTGLTLLLGGVDLGAWHAIVGLAIASAKATLIVLFFMHLVHSPRTTWLVAATTLLFLAILLLMTLTDYLSRGWPT